MKIHLTILFFFIAVVSFGQTTRVSTSSNTNNPLVYTVNGADKTMKARLDSLATVLIAEFNKKLADSMALLQPVKPITDAIDATNKNVASLTSNVNNNNSNLNGLTNRVITLENNGANYNSRLSNLESWKNTTDGKLTEMNAKILLIPTKAISSTTTTSTSTTVTELKP